MDQRRFVVVDRDGDEPKPLTLSFSLLRLSAPVRLAIAACLVLALWATVLWALA